MPYIGRGLEKGNYLKLDDISSQFDGSKTTFDLTVGGSAHVPGSSYSLLVSLSGIIQEGEAAYTLDQNQITFAAAPQAVDDCYIISLGTPIGIGVPGDGTVSGPQFAKPFNYENFFYLDHTTQRVGIGTTVPTQSLDVYDGNIAIRDPATASQFLGFYHNRNVLKASIDKTGNNLTFENVDSGIIDFKNNGSSRVGIGSTGKIFFASDDNTYFYRPGADTLGFLVGGDEKLRINGDRVIIGLSDSNNLPTFNASTTLATVYTNNPAAFNAISIIGGHTTGAAFVKFGDRDNERQGQIGYYNQDDSMRFFVNGNTTEKLRISSTGKVGIGTTNPESPLSIFSDAADEELIHFDMGSPSQRRGWKFKQGETGTSTELVLQADENGKVFQIKNSSGGEQFYVYTESSNAYVRIDPELHISDTILHVGDQDTKIRFPAANTISMETAGSERVRITGIGSVGIGTTNPTEILDVRGNLVVAEALAVNRPRIVLSAPDDGTNYRHLFGANLQVNSSGTFTTPTANISGGGWEYLPANSLNAHGEIRYLSAPDTNATSSTPEERFRIDSGGRVGIATTNPTTHLQIGGLGVDSDNVIKFGRRINSANTNLPLIGHHSGDGTGSGLALCATSNQGAIHFFTGNGGNGFGASNNEERVIIKHDGEVGIGTTNPENLLDVNQSFGRQRFNKYGHYIAKNNGASTTEYWTFAPRSSGNLGIGRGAPDIEGTVGVANDKLTIKSTGEVGIGSTHPTTKLDVRGHIKVDGGPILQNSTNTGDVLNITSATGYLELGSRNSSYVHFMTDRSRYYFNRKIIVDEGIIGSYNEDLVLTTDIDEERIRIDNDTGNVGIGTATIDKKLTVYGGVGIDGTHATQVTLDVDNRVGMANTAGSEQLILNLRGDVANNQQLVFKNYRLRNGSDWTTSTFRIQKVVDVTKMGYIDFGTGSGNAGRDMQFGNGSGTVYMHFDSSQGHVGIGTTAPRQKFEVIGTVASGRPTFQHESGYGGLQIAGPAMGSGASLFFTRGYASSGTGTTTFSLFMAGGDQSLNFVAGDASEYLTKTKMMIENTGFVGIGTRNPDEELHVYGTASDPSIFLENGATGTSDDTILKFGIGGTTANNYIYFGDADDSNVGQIRYNHDLDFMTFTTGASERVRIFGDGRMNIGGSSEVQLTTNSTAVLHLNGAIVGANVDGAFGARIIIDDDDTGTTSGGDRERGSILAQFNGNASGGDTSDECRLWNIHSDVNCTADYDNCYGLYSDVRTSHTSGTITAMRGAYGIVQTTSSGSISEMVGLYGIAQPTTGSSGTVNDLVGGKFRANMAAGNSTAKATDLFGVWSQIDNDNDVNQATSGTRTALFYGNYDKTTGLNDPQGIRIDTDVPNYFRGGLAVGQSSNTLPTGKLDVEGDVNVSSGEITVSTPEYLRVGHTNAAHNQTIADNDTVVVQFGSEYDDTKNGWTTGASNYYTIQKTGYFLVTTQAVITSNTASSLRDWALGVEMSTDNGGSWSLIQNAGGRGGGNNNTDTDTVTPVVTFILNFTAGTRIRVRAYANTDGGNWQVDEDLGDTSGGSDYGGANFDNQKGTRLHIMRLH